MRFLLAFNRCGIMSGLVETTRARRYRALTGKEFTVQTMWQFTLGRFTVRARITPSTDLDLSWCETGETARNLDSGLWEAFDTRVSVELNGAEIGSNWLCGSIYENPRDFFTEHYGINATGCGAYFPDMVREAIGEARKWIASARLAA